MVKITAYIKTPYGEVLTIDPVKDASANANIVKVVAEDGTLYLTDYVNVLFKQEVVKDTCEPKEKNDDKT